jgi:superfamily I DNA/RNA helicase
MYPSFFSFAPNTSAMSRATEGFSAIQTIIRYSFSGTKVIKRGQGQSFDQTIDEFMEIASLSSDQDDDKKEKHGVRLMTVHASKGLEFDVVFVVGLEDGLFPSKNFAKKVQGCLCADKSFTS